MPESAAHESLDQDLKGLSPIRFQDFVWDFLKALGFQVKLRGGTGQDPQRDHTFDYVTGKHLSFTEPWIVQCKHTSAGREGGVGVGDIEQIANHCIENEAIGYLLVTNGRLSDPTIITIGKHKGLFRTPIKASYWDFKLLSEKIFGNIFGADDSIEKKTLEVFLRTWLPTVSGWRDRNRQVADPERTLEQVKRELSEMAGDDQGSDRK